MSHRHEQKHLLHNWSDRRYRDHPQSPRAVLRVSLDSGAIATSERLADESFRLCSVGQRAPWLLPRACARSLSFFLNKD
jgi:hypothetical protein